MQTEKEALKVSDESEDRKVVMTILGGGGMAANVFLNLVSIISPGESSERIELKFKAFNTDKEDLAKLPSQVEKIQIGKVATKGWGAGHDPNVGLMAAEENDADFDAVLEESDITVIMGGLGGGSGTAIVLYAARKLHEKLQAQKDLNIHEQKAGFIIVTLPFKKEDYVTEEIALEALAELQDMDVPMMVIENDRFFCVKQSNTEANSNNGLVEDDMEVMAAMAEGNMIIAKMLGRTQRSLGKPHNFMNTDRNDIIRSFLRSAKPLGFTKKKLAAAPVPSTTFSTEAYFGVGYGKGENRVKQALEQAANNPLLTTKLEGCKKVILTVECNKFTRMEWDLVEEFQKNHSKHKEVHWRRGLSTDYEPLPFEKGKTAADDPEVAVLVLGMDHEPVGNSAEEPSRLALESQSQLHEGVTMRGEIIPSLPDVTPKALITTATEVEVVRAETGTAGAIIKPTEALPEVPPQSPVEDSEIPPPVEPLKQPVVIKADQIDTILSDNDKKYDPVAKNSKNGSVAPIS